LLLDAGLSQPMALLLLIGINILLAAVGLMLARLHLPLATTAGIYVLAVLVLMVSFDSLRIRLSRINRKMPVLAARHKI
jgi:hypothetical protein